LFEFSLRARLIPGFSDTLSSYLKYVLERRLAAPLVGYFLMHLKTNPFGQTLRRCVVNTHNGFDAEIFDARASKSMSQFSNRRAN